jgi:Resolvase, N terminal domain
MPIRTVIPTRIALYAEANPSDPQCEIQLRHLREYSARHSGALVREYVDIDAGRSASPPLRPSRGQLRKDAHGGHFDWICVWQLENWNCGSVFASLATIREFLSRGQCFVAVADQIHLERSNRDSQLVLSTLTACAAWERQARQRRVPVRSNGGVGHGRQWTIAERAKLWQRGIAVNCSVFASAEESSGTAKLFIAK